MDCTRCQIGYDEISRAKGNHHSKIQPFMGEKRWYDKIQLSVMETRWISRLRTRHGLCGFRKFQFGLADSDLCEEWGVVDNLEHIMLKCEKYSIVRSKYSEIEKDNLLSLMKLVNVKKYSRIVNFIKEAKIVKYRMLLLFLKRSS